MRLPRSHASATRPRRPIRAFRAVPTAAAIVALALAGCGGDDPGDGDGAAAGATTTATGGTTTPSGPAAPPMTTTAPAPGPAPTRSGPSSRFLAEVDVVCVRHARDVRTLTRQLGTPSTFADRAPVDARRAQAVRAQADRLRALRPPPELRDRFAAFVGAATAYADAFEASARASAAGDETAWRPTVRAHLDRGDALLASAAELGLGPCSRRPSASMAAAVRATTERVLLGRDPERSCTGDVTSAFLRSNLSGSRRSCLQVLRGLRADGATVTFVETAGVRGITGVDTVIASANVRFATTRDRPAKDLVYDLVWEDGRWRLDSAFEPPADDASSGRSS
ncbi:MAG: hypothetical protein M0P31_01440 [Solirubrobacteraceae bacterium]|nr:hypothetical protein [Solirubrobacteraceae bacterium]